MLAGEPYYSRAPELLGMYHRARALLADYAATPSTNAERKQELLTSLLGRVGRDVWIEAPFFCDYGENIAIGDGVFINYNCVFLDCNRITIGNDVLVGPAVQIYTATHPLDPRERIRRDAESGGSTYVTRALPVEVGDNAWLGGGALLMPGISIGENTTIGAGSVVTQSIPPHVFAAGNPCRVMREFA